jgi:S-adenosylmethionine:diacylglycerol 3-amino-3-carboxypropyl transferase
MEWIAQHGFGLLQTIGIVAGLLFTAFTIRADARERRIENLFTITSAHREIWKTLYDRPELFRVLEKSCPDGRTPIPTFEERLFVRSLILHLAAAFRARTYGMHFQEHGLAADVRQFFSRPIPQAVWKSVCALLEPDFVTFVENCFVPTDGEES